jgi:phospholipase/lecithinase/hemolysin
LLSSDNGNAYIGTGGVTPAPPLYTVGRFTEGPDTIPAGTAGGIWHEVLSGLLGEPIATPFVTGGTNFAVGGAKVLPGDPIIPSLAQQVGLALAASNGLADPNALYILWGGANDLYGAVETLGETAAGVAATETTVINSLVSDIVLLTATGARDFLWLNLPQLATTPRGQTDPLNVALSQASAQFRTDVANESALLDLSLGVHIADVDVYSLYQSIVANPGAFGYTNVTMPAQGLNVNPDQYLFWDLPSHPTTTGHRLIALSADTAVINLKEFLGRVVREELEKRRDVGRGLLPVCKRPAHALGDAPRYAERERRFHASRSRPPAVNAQFAGSALLVVLRRWAPRSGLPPQ